MLKVFVYVNFLALLIPSLLGLDTFYSKIYRLYPTGFSLSAVRLEVPMVQKDGGLTPLKKSQGFYNHLVRAQTFERKKYPWKVVDAKASSVWVYARTIQENGGGKLAIVQHPLFPISPEGLDD